MPSTVTKIFALLDALAEEREATVKRLADVLGEPRSTVYRVIGQLQRLELIEPGAQSGTYRLGLRLFRLGSSVITRFDERQAALPVMERLHEQTEETVFLCIRVDYEAVCIERIDGRWVQSMALRLGGSLPLHIGAAPRTLLAFEPSSFWEEYLLHGDLGAFTPKSPVTRDALVPLLEEIRTSGYSVSDEDVVRGMAAVGAPIFDYRGAIRAAISLSGPRPTLLDENTDRSVELITAGAAEISAVLGYQDTPRRAEGRRL
jgi:DNA-binding IclR family transcriptional regulator